MATKLVRITPVPGMHSAGIYADPTGDGPEIGTLVVIIDRAKNLPNRRTMGKQDPYCAARLGKEAKKTPTDVRGGQTPKWDHEMRFTVRDSPDYYNLKVSVFNDDKKTDIIGETLVNLEDVVVPGGGQSDLWHPLKCKGKYAGEIRFEMTYYDNRPKIEKPADVGGMPQSIAESKRTSLAGPRHETPVKRRPLPADPTGHSPSPHVGPDSAPRALPSHHDVASYHTPPPLRTHRAPDDHNANHSHDYGVDFGASDRPDLNIGPTYSRTPPNQAFNRDSSQAHHQMDQFQQLHYGQANDFGSYHSQSNGSREFVGPDGHLAQENRGPRFDDAPSKRHSYAATSFYERSQVSAARPEHDVHFLPPHQISPSRPQGSIAASHPPSAPGIPQYEHSPTEISQNGFPHDRFHSESHMLSQNSPHHDEYRDQHDDGSFRRENSQQRLSGHQMDAQSNHSPHCSYDLPGYCDQTNQRTSYGGQPGVPANYMQPTVEDDDDVPPPPPIHRNSPSTAVHSSPSWRHTYRDEMQPSPLSLSARGSAHSSTNHSNSNGINHVRSQDPFVGSEDPQALHVPHRKSLSSAYAHGSVGVREPRRMTLATFPNERLDHPSSLVPGYDQTRMEDSQPTGADVMTGTDPYSQLSSSYQDPYHGHAHQPRAATNGDASYGAVHSYGRSPPVDGPTRRESMYPHEPVGRRSSNINDSPAHSKTPSAVAPLIKPRAITPEVGPAPLPPSRTIPTRKSVSPRPSSLSQDHTGSQSSVPFSPDSYDALNPSVSHTSSSSHHHSRPTSHHSLLSQPHSRSLASSSSPSHQPPTTTDTSTEAPIVTPDGRVIDPSDHLPVDSWAPEPERKTAPKAAPIRIRVGLRGAQPMPAHKLPDRSSATHVSPTVSPGGGGPSLRQHPPPVPAKVPLGMVGSSAQGFDAEDLVALSEEMKSIDIGTGNGTRRAGVGAGAGGRVRRSRFGA